jgi:hypothetical protein
VINEAAIRRRYETLGPYLDERQRRVFATSEALVRTAVEKSATVAAG